MGGVLAAIWTLWFAQARRRLVVLLLLWLLAQIAAWTFFTHQQSRFLLPAALPLTLMLAVALEGSSRVRSVTRAIVAPAWCLAPALIFFAQRDGNPLAAIDGGAVLRGEVHAARLASGEFDPALLADAPPATFINHVLDEGSRVLLVGESAPFELDLNRITYQTTWDRGPLSRAMAEHADDPSQWTLALQHEGFTHVLVHPAMLERWERSGWNDPNLTAARVLDWARTELRLIHEFRGGVALLALPAPAALRSP